MMDEGVTEFVECFLQRGWRGIERDYGSSTTVNRRLIARAGGPALLEQRAAHNRSGNTGRTGRRAGGWMRMQRPVSLCALLAAGYSITATIGAVRAVTRG